MAPAAARLLIVLAAVALPATVLAAGPKEPQKRHTAADMKLARSIGLRHSDLAAGWQTSKPAPQDDSTCAAAPDESSLVETADVDPTFDSPGGGAVTVDSEVQLFGSARQAAMDWRAGNAAMLRSCAAQEMRRQFGASAKVSVVAVASPRLAGVRTKSFRMVVDAVYKGKRVVVQSDVIGLGKGRAEVLLSGTALQGMFKPTALKPLAALLATRLRAARV